MNKSYLNWRKSELVEKTNKQTNTWIYEELDKEQIAELDKEQIAAVSSTKDLSIRQRGS